MDLPIKPSYHDFNPTHSLSVLAIKPCFVSGFLGV